MTTMSLSSPRSPRVESAKVLPTAVTLSWEQDVWTPDAATLKDKAALLADMSKFARVRKAVSGFDLRGLELTSDVILALSSYATQLKMLSIADCGNLRIATFSPLLICNVGSLILSDLE